MSLIEELQTAALPLMKSYQSDLAHDEAWIKANPGDPFIHVVREMGTHLVPLPKSRELVENKPTPHLFGHALPAVIYKQYRELLAGQLAELGVRWSIYDGKRLRKTTAAAALAYYDQCLTRAQSEAARQRQAGARSAYAY